MKRIKLYMIMIVSVAVLSFSCDPLEDEVNEIKASRVEVQDVAYTLTDADYDDLDEACDCVGFNGFSTEDDVKNNIPTILNNVFPALGKGSSAAVTYNFDRGSNVAIDPFLDASRYEVSDADYLSVSAETGDAGFFNNTTTFADNISDVLNTNIASPVGGDLIAVTYKESQIEYVDINFTEIYAEDFGSVVGVGDLSGVQTISVEGAEVWEWDDSSSGYNYAGMSGFGDVTGNIDWLITPEIDLTGFNSAELRLRHVLAFLDAPGAVGTDIIVRVSTDYDGINPSTATWTDLTFNSFPTGDGPDFGQYDSKASLSEFADEQIYIGFYYHSTLDFAGLWRVIDINVSQGDDLGIETNNIFYTYEESSTTWSPDGDEAYFMSSADYETFGFSFPNFSSSNRAENYLPQFLAKTLRPFAQEEDVQIVIYDYFSSFSGAGVRGDLFTFIGGEWVEYASGIETILNFGHDGTTWVPDNTIKYTFSSADFAVAGDEANGLGNAAARDNLRTFGNFGTQWSRDEVLVAIGFVLKLNFPAAEIGQKYLVTYSTFPAGDLSALLILDASGDYIEVLE